MEEFGLPLQTVYADLIDRCLAAGLVEAFPEDGGFVLQTVKGRGYWYHQRTVDGRQVKHYVGVDSPELRSRIERLRQAKSEWSVRRRMVQALKRAGMPAPDPFVGSVLDALARAGVFRLRAVVVGTVAYQVYGPLLGVRLPARSLMTGDLDLAQFPAISIAVEDRTEPLLDILRGVDPSFEPISAVGEPASSIAYRNARNFRVEILAPNRGPDRDEPIRLPALGTDAQPLRFLDVLIYQAVPAVMLHGGGVPVNVPAPERYALHKLIVARRRPPGAAKVDKDVVQATALLEVLSDRRPFDLAEIWEELTGRGPEWRRLAEEGLSLVRDDVRARVRQAIMRSGVPD